MKGFGVVELMDDKDTGNGGFFCVKLVTYLSQQFEWVLLNILNYGANDFKKQKRGIVIIKAVVLFMKEP